MKLYKIILADDHQIFLEGMNSLLQKEFDIIKCVQNGRELVSAVKKYSPHAVVTDIAMPLMNGIEATRLIKKTNPKIVVIALTMHLDTFYANMAFDAGVSGFVLKNSPSQELITAIHEGIKGRTYVSPLIAGELLLHLKGKSSKLGGPTNFTPRQREILQLLSEGMTAKKIGESLNISTRTVEHHKYKMMKLLNTKSTSALVRYVIEKKIIAI